MAEESKQPMFRDISADDTPELLEVESLCMECEEMGTTRILMTRIPFFKEVILTSFECPHCGSKNNFVQPGTAIQDKGCKIVLKINSPKDLDRQVVKQGSASFSVPELNFETPAFTQKGELNTIEGLLERAVSGLEREQPVRKITDPDTANKIDGFLSEMKKFLKVEKKFTVVLDDPSGNSFIENPHAPKDDPNMTVTLYDRTSEQNEQLGLATSADVKDVSEEEEVKEEAPSNQPDKIKDEVLSFPTNCSSCQSPAETRMKMVAIPHFKEVVIMATTCDVCGHRTNEVKSGSGIEPKGTKMTLNITDPADLNRDVLKSETCEVNIPELDFEMQMGTLGGKFTTLEGLLTNVRDHLKSINPFGFGDSPALSTSSLESFLSSLDKIISGELMSVHIVMDDPAGNSYIQNLYAPDPDPELTVEHYERTEEQNDDLGISDMQTEGYEENQEQQDNESHHL